MNLQSGRWRYFFRKPKRKASGRNVTEAERSGVQVKLRLPADVADDLDDIAARWGLTRSGAVARMIEVTLNV